MLSFCTICSFLYVTLSIEYLFCHISVFVLLQHLSLPLSYPSTSYVPLCQWIFPSAQSVSLSLYVWPSYILRFSYDSSLWVTLQLLLLLSVSDPSFCIYLFLVRKRWYSNKWLLIERNRSCWRGTQTEEQILLKERITHIGTEDVEKSLIQSNT